MTRVHYIHPRYLGAPRHPLGITLVGCGGSGSAMLALLADMSIALTKQGHPGLHVTAYDPDTVDEYNPGRQRFSNADVGQRKARVLVERINRFYGLDWTARATRFGAQTPKKDGTLDRNRLPFMLIGCVDSIAARADLHTASKHFPYYMDLGNNRDHGQVIVGGACEQPTPPEGVIAIERLPRFLEWAGLTVKEAKATPDDNEPSCSMAESLGKQDLFINRTLATAAANLLWQLVHEGHILHHGVIVNTTDHAQQPISL